MREKEDVLTLKEIDRKAVESTDKIKYDKLRLEVAQALYDKLLPEFQKLIDDNKWNLALIITPRNIGKSYNVAMMIVILMLRMNTDATAARKYKTRVKASISKTFKKVINETQDSKYFDYFDFYNDSIRFRVGSIVRTISLEGLADPDNFKGTEDLILWVDEAQQLRQIDFQTAFPSIRSTDKKQRVIVTSNIPVDGKKSWIYKEFVEKDENKERTRYVHLTFKDNPIAFPDQEAIDIWKEDQKQYFYGYKEKYLREIEGIWLEHSEYNLFKHWSLVENSNLNPNLWIVLYESGQYFNLGIKIQGETITIAKEDYGQLEDHGGANIVLCTENTLPIYINNSNITSRLLTREPAPFQKLSSWFATRMIYIEKTCDLSASEISIASFDVNDDDSYLIDKQLSKNIRGLVVRALQILISYIS